MKKTAYIGIDLGTTNTTCAALVIDENNSKELIQIPIQYIRFLGDDSQELILDEKIPSCVIVSEKSNNIFCGVFDSVNEASEYYPILNTKTKLGNDIIKFSAGGKFLTPIGISAVILKTVYKSLIDFLEKSQIESVISITITIPASFSSQMRRATLDAAIMAGFEEGKIKLLDEPVAAIFSGFDVKESSFKSIVPENKLLLVYDMGGGTVDVSILRISNANKTVEILASSRYNELGGSDFDLAIAGLFLKKINEIPGAFEKMLPNAESKFHKIKFSNKLLTKAKALKEDINIGLETLNLNPQSIEELKTRSDLPTFEIEFNSDSDREVKFSVHLKDIINCIKRYISIDAQHSGRNIFNPLNQVFEKIDSMVARMNFIVGGSSNFSLIKNELERELLNLNNSLDAKFSISNGAAVFAFLSSKENWKILERTNEKIFLRRNGAPPLEIFPENLPIPSGEINPPKELEFGDTINIPQGTIKLDLEFLQGKSVNDFQLSVLHKEELVFPEPILITGSITKIVGKIDSNKEYRFNIQVSEEDIEIYSKEIQFSKSYKKLKGKKAYSEISGFTINNM